jgi:hypothetical protein
MVQPAEDILDSDPAGGWQLMPLDCRSPYWFPTEIWNAWPQAMTSSKALSRIANRENAPRAELRIVTAIRRGKRTRKEALPGEWQRTANAHEDQRQHVCRDRDMGFNPKLDRDEYCYEGRASGHHADQTRGEEYCDLDEQLWRWHEAIISTRSECVVP